MFESLKRRRIPAAALAAALALILALPAVAQEEGASQPTEAPAGTPAETPAPRAEIAFGTGVDREAREVTGQATSFATADFVEETGQVFCLSRVLHAGAPATVTHVWYHEGKTMAKVDLNVGSEDWRTWSSKKILKSWTGAWEVKVLDANGMVLATAGFVIE